MLRISSFKISSRAVIDNGSVLNGYFASRHGKETQRSNLVLSQIFIEIWIISNSFSARKLNFEIVEYFTNQPALRFRKNINKLKCKFSVKEMQSGNDLVG